MHFGKIPKNVYLVDIFYVTAALCNHNSVSLTIRMLFFSLRSAVRKNNNKILHCGVVLKFHVQHFDKCVLKRKLRAF